MKKLVILFVFLAGFSPILPGTESKGFRFRDTIKTAWSKFWSISCEFSTFVSRSKRSIEIPDVSDVDQVFEFLYPMAHVTVEDIKSGKGRSNGDEEEESFGFFKWFDTLKDLWKTQCKSRRENDQGVPREQQAQETMGASDSTPQMNNNNNTIQSMDNLGNNNMTKTNVTAEKLPGEEEFVNGTTHTFENSTLGRTDMKQGPGSGLPSIFPSLPPIALPTLSPLASKQVNNFSASLGGDIEYFFPLISFGLPFDGEITLLGFHGFKGLFPYKR